MVFVGRLIGDATMARCLDQRHPEVFKEFGVIVQAVSLDKGAAA